MVFYLTLTVLLHYLEKIQKSKITAELLLTPSKLLGFTWNLTKLNNM